MPHISQLKESRFLKKEECDPPILVTVNDCVEYNVANEGAPEQLKWCLSFAEVEKPMVLNSTNAQIIAAFIGSENTDDWIGHKLVLYSEPNISYNGKLVGGIRARAPRNQAVPVKAAAKAPTAPVEPQAKQTDDVPF